MEIRGNMNVKWGFWFGHINYKQWQATRNNNNETGSWVVIQLQDNMEKWVIATVRKQ